MTMASASGQKEILQNIVKAGNQEASIERKSNLLFLLYFNAFFFNHITEHQTSNMLLQSFGFVVFSNFINIYFYQKVTCE